MNGLGPLLRQRLRRDRTQLLLWIAGTGALAAAGYPGVQGSYGDEQERAALLATVLANPVILLFRGLPSGAGEDQLVTFLLLPWLLILAAFLSSFLAVRHTRGDEEDGRLDLLSATPASRWTPTVATILHGAIANAVLGLVVAAVFLANGAAVTGSIVVGLSCTLTGLVFLGVGLVAAQVMPTSRAANALATWTLVGTFVLAGIGNALGTPSDDLTRLRSSWLTWLSPFGWGENARAFDVDAAGPLLLLTAAAAALVGGALALQSRRDLGGSFVAERVGRADAGRGLASHLALVARLARPSLIGWAVAGLLIGVVTTALGGVADEVGGENPAVADVLDRLGGGGDLARGIVVVFFVMLGILAACAGVQTVVRARQDEARGTAEPVLATPVPRVRWLADHLAVALVGAAVTLAAGVLGATLGATLGAAGATGGAGGAAGGGAGGADAATLARDAAIAGAGQVLPAWLFAGLTALAFVVAPRLTIGAGWSLVVLAAGLGLFGTLFGIDAALTKLSPFAAAATPTPDGVDWGGTAWIALVAAALVAASLTLMRRRELAPAG